MSNFGILLNLLSIIALTRGSIDANNEEVSRMGCPQVDSSLDLTGVGFGSVPDGFVKNDFLTHLILDQNQLSSVSSETFSFVPKLVHLSLKNNLLTSLDLEPFSKLSELETLILSENCKSEYIEPNDSGNRNYYSEYDTTPRNVQYSPMTCNLKIDTVLHSLMHLYVENNNIRQLSADGSGKLPALTHLYLSHNFITINDETMLALKKHMPALTHLYLKSCVVSELDTLKLPPVTSLYLDENHIIAICNEYCLDSGLNLNLATQLTTLSVSHNQIAHIEVDSFKDTINLATLDLSHNQISNIIEGTFDELTSLEYLNLENNHLNRLNAIHTSNHLINLNSLLLGGNNISHVSNEDFKNMLTLKTLMLNDNKISIIESGTFSNLTDLQELSLAGNQLSSILMDSMPTFASLIALNLENNNFISAEAISIVNLPSLVALYLKDNPLTMINADWLKNAGENLTIYLQNTCPYISIQSL